jgi:hypothetical protein
MEPASTRPAGRESGPRVHLCHGQASFSVNLGADPNLRAKIGGNRLARVRALASLDHEKGYCRKRWCVRVRRRAARLQRNCCRRADVPNSHGRQDVEPLAADRGWPPPRESAGRAHETCFGTGAGTRPKLSAGRRPRCRPRWSDAHDDVMGFTLATAALG